MTAGALYDDYVAAGDDPFVRGPGAAFSAWDYARQRCEILCGGQIDRKGD